MLRRYGIKPNKEWGQNFLTSMKVAKKILSAAEITHEDTVLEIGGGLGVLSKPLAIHAGRLYVIEIDDKLVHVLSDHLSEFKNVKVIRGDVLKISMPNASKIVGNLPYNIASQITFRLLNEVEFNLAILMFQKEFAMRLLARPGSPIYSRVAIDFQYMGCADHLFDVPAKEFFPVPKVDSSVLAVRKRKEGPFAKDSTAFFRIVHGIYSYPKKQLGNALKFWFKRMNRQEELQSVLKSLENQVDLTQRLRSLRMEDLITLSDCIYEMIQAGEITAPWREDL